MAHKSKDRGQQLSTDALPGRIQKARAEGRHQQALELARQLYKHEPSEHHLNLLRETSLDRGKQLESQKHFKEAAVVYLNASEMGGPPEFRRQLVERIARCGAGPKAVALAESLGDPQLVARVWGHIVDGAMQEGPAGRSQLAAELQGHFDVVVQAFAHAEAKRDDEARAALQSIGLGSPFLEWRVLIRGLLAYYAGDNPRALENWQRLDAERLPFQLAVPLRFGIDPAFAAAQPPRTQEQLRHTLDRLEGNPLTPALRKLQPMLSREGQLAKAFREAEHLLPGLRQQTPDLVPRLAACFRWAIVEHGDPEDRDRYLRVFGPLPDDPYLNRVSALAMEKRGDIEEAHLFWADYEAEIAETPTLWPADQARHVRALILTHMGQLAGEAADEEGAGFLPMRIRRKKPGNFKPTAEQCFRRAIKLAPEMLSAHEALFAHLLEHRSKKAAQAGKKLLERFPDHVSTLSRMADLSIQSANLDDAQEYLREALRVNPLARDLRLALEKVHELKARLASISKRVDEARVEVKAALGMYDLPDKFPILCLATIIEAKAKNQAGYEELRAQAVSNAESTLVVDYCLLCECVRQQATPAEKKPFTAAFAKGLTQPMSNQELVRLLQLAVRQRSLQYHGQKSHEKKILALVGKQELECYAEPQLESLCESLKELHAPKLLNRACRTGQRLFPENPVFLMVDAAYWMMTGAHGLRYREIQENLRKARELIQKMPRGERQQQLLGRLEETEAPLGKIAGAQSFFDHMMDGFFGFGPFGEDDYTDDDDYDDDY